jgi:leucyl-tRNA synthetase
MKQYDHKKIEKKWQTYWAKKGVYATKDVSKKPKQYVLDMFPYPSGEGLHVGHPKGYIATDVYSRMSRMQGKEVLHPMGWDAFGLPAENYAIKNKIHPRKAVEKNIKRFKEQLKMIGLDYDWKRELNTTDPQFYKWTQWIFLKLYEKGLAYESNEPINWCPTCQTGLSNEDLEGNACERCGTIVEKRPMRQWVLKITEYADRMLEDLKLLPEWQEHIKESQRNWIGKSEGAEIDFPLKIANEKMNRVILLHGKGGSPDGDFLRWAKGELEKSGYTVDIPALPNTNEPDDIEQAEYIKKNCVIDENTILAGHSAGGLAAMRLLETTKAGRLLLIATPFSENFLDGKKRQTVARSLARGYDFEKIRSNVKGVIALYDTSDPVIPISDGEMYAQKFGGYLIKIKAVDGHFNAAKEPDVLMAIRPTIRVFTTRPDTLYGATFLILSPEHPWVTLAIRDDHKGVLKNQEVVRNYVKRAAEKTEIERQENKDKTGVRLEGVEAINPASGEKIPVYVADYVLAGYGTGAIMAVPSHDERDFEFANKFNLPIRQVIAPVVRATTGGDAVRPDVEFKPRDAVMGIIKHWEKDEYLCISWKNAEMRTFPSGGIEHNEKPEETVVREIQEETGYQNVVVDKQLGGFEYIEFYHQIKKTNVRARFRYFLGHLEDGEHKEVATEESAMHEVVWKPREELRSYVTLKEKDRILGILDGKPEEAHIEFGILVNSGPFNGLLVEEAKEQITNQFGRKKTTYKIRDWVFSRQRYWGEPIPVIHCPKDGVVPVPEKDLPVKLPDVKNYKPTGTGESPLAAIKKWVNVKCPVCKGPAKRETNTMPQWAGSSWYYLRYMDPKNKKALVDKKKEKYWAPVDLYVGGAEHATRHLIYARFWHKFLYDIGAVSTLEPFTRLISVGLIQAEDGRKMSKRFGNVINPDDIVKLYGADTLRVYEMFMGPFTDAIAWNTNSMIGARRFLERIWRMQEKVSKTQSENAEKLLHRTIKKVGEDIRAFKFNTAISTMMIFVNAAEKEGITKQQFKTFLQLLAPFAPHIAEDIWQSMGNKKSIHISPWPTYEKKYLEDETVTFVVQINGKVRAQVEMPANATESEVQTAAEPLAKEWLKTRILKVVFVPKRLINFVVAKS